VLNNINSNQPFLAVHGFRIDRIPSNDGFRDTPFAFVLWSEKRRSHAFRDLGFAALLPKPEHPDELIDVDVGAK
jgi:hypothetical protein